MASFLKPKDYRCATGHALRARSMRFAYGIHADFSSLVPRLELLFLQQLRKSNQKEAAPLNVLILIYLN